MIGPPQDRIGVEQIPKPATDPLASVDRHPTIPVHRNPKDLRARGPGDRALDELQPFLREQRGDQLHQLLAPHALILPETRFAPNKNADIRPRGSHDTQLRTLTQ